MARRIEVQINHSCVLISFFFCHTKGVQKKSHKQTNKKESPRRRRRVCWRQLQRGRENVRGQEEEDEDDEDEEEEVQKTNRSRWSQVVKSG